MTTNSQIPAKLSALCISTLLFLVCWHMSILVAEEYSYSESSEVKFGRYWRGHAHVSSPAIAVLKAEAAIAEKVSACNSQFPRKVWQLWKNAPADHLAATTELSGVWRQVNHGYRYERFTKDTGIAYARTALHAVVWDDEEQDEIIQKLECMDEQDQLFEEFLKYLVLAVEGGVWADVDAVPLTPISSWAHAMTASRDDDISHLDLVVAMDTTSKSRVHFSPTAVLAKPNHPAILETLMSVIHEIQESVCPTTQDSTESLVSIELMKRWVLPRRSIYSTNEDKQTSKDQQEQGQDHVRTIRLKHVRPGHPLYDVTAGTYLEINEEDTSNHDNASPSQVIHPEPQPQVTTAYSPRPPSQRPLNRNKPKSDTSPVSFSYTQDRLTMSILSHLFRHHDLKFETDNLAQLARTNDPVRIGDVVILPSGMGFDRLSFDAQDSHASYSVAADVANRDGNEVKSTAIVFHPKPLLVLAEDGEE